MTTVARVLAEAAAEIGYSEAGHSNRTKYAQEAGHPNGQAWCATFVVAILRRCHVPIPHGVSSPSSRTMITNAKKAGLGVRPVDIRPGDIIHTWRGATIGKWLGHVGIVETVHNTTITTIEGNTNAAGSATGGQVLRKTRPKSWWLLSAWRPHYAAVEPTRQILALPSGALATWTGQTRDDARVVVHIATIAQAQSLISQGWTVHNWSGKTVQ